MMEDCVLCEVRIDQLIGLPSGLKESMARILGTGESTVYVVG